MGFQGYFPRMERRFPFCPNIPIFFRKFKDMLWERRQTEQVAKFVPRLFKNAIVEVRLASEICNARAWTIVVVHDCKNFLVAGLEFCHAHAGILAVQEPILKAIEWSQAF